MNIVDILVKENIFPTRGEARHMITCGAVKVNGELIKSYDADIDTSEVVTITKGKKEYRFLLGSLELSKAEGSDTTGSEQGDSKK